MKKIMTTMLVAAMVLSMAAPATAATPARDLEAASQKAATKATTAYTLKMSNKTLKFYKNGKVVRSEMTKDGKVTLRKSNAGGISVLFTDTKGKTKNITLGKQMDITLEGTFVQISADKTLTKAHTIRLKKGSKATSFYARAAAKYVLSGTISTLNVTNKNAQVKVEGTVTKAYTVSKSAITGLASSKIKVNKTGTAAGGSGTNTSNTSGRDTYYSNGSSSTGGGSNSGVVNPPSNGGNNNKPDTNPPDVDPDPDDKPPEENVETIITADATNQEFLYDVIIVTNGQNLKMDGCTFKGKVTVVNTLNEASGIAMLSLARASETGSVSFTSSTMEELVEVKSPVSITTDETTSASKIAVAENVTVPSIKVEGDVTEIAVPQNAVVKDIAVAGNANPVVSGKGNIQKVTVNTDSGTPGVSVTAKVDAVEAIGSGKADSISIGGSNSDTKVDIKTDVAEIIVSNEATVKVEVDANKKVDTVTSTTTGTTTSGSGAAIEISGSGSVGKIDTTKEEQVSVGNDVKGDTANSKPVVETIVLKRIAVTGPTKKEYFVGEALDLNGLTVTATYQKGQNPTYTKVVPLGSVKVTGFNSGSAAATQQVTVTFEGETATFDVIIKAAELTSVAVTPSEFIMTSTAVKQTLKVIEKWNGKPGTATRTWKSSNENIATVSSNGEVTAVANGSATITVTAKAGSKELTATTKVQVAIPAENAITLQKVTQNNTEVALKADSYPVSRTGDVAVSFVPNYAKENAEVTINGEKSTAVDLVKDQAVSIPLTIGADDENAKEYKVVVDGHEFNITLNIAKKPAVTEITVTPATKEIEVGETVQLTAAVVTVGGASNEVTWESSDTTVASVDSDGKVTAVKAAETPVKITATSTADTSKKAEATITVKAEGALKAINKANSAEAVKSFLENVEYVKEANLDKAKYNSLCTALQGKVHEAVMVDATDASKHTSLVAFKTAFDKAVADQIASSPATASIVDGQTAGPDIYYDTVQNALKVAEVEANASKRVTIKIVGNYVNEYDEFTIATNADVLIGAGSSFTNPTGKTVKITGDGTIKGQSETSKLLNESSSVIGVSDTSSNFHFKATSSYTWNGEKWVEDKAPLAVASVETAHTLTGQVGKELEGTDKITIKLTNAQFKEMAAGISVKSWFTNLPEGLDVKTEEAVQANATSVKLVFSGAPTAVVPEAAMEIAIPKASLVDAAENLAVNANGSTFAIAAADVASAAIDAKFELTGKVNEALTAKEVTVTLTNAKFAAITADQDVTGWFTGLPAGVVVKSKEAVTAEAKTAILVISGTPTAATEGVVTLAIKIPQASLVGATEDLTVDAKESTISIAAADEATAEVKTKATITGKAGTALDANQKLAIDLTNAKFAAIAADTSVKSWFTNLPAGLDVKPDAAVAANATTATFVFSGEPTAAANNVAMTISIPKESLVSAEAALTVNAKESVYNISAADEAVTGTARGVVGENTIDVTLTKGTFVDAATTVSNWTVESNTTNKVAVTIGSVTLNPAKTVATLTFDGEAKIASGTTYTVTMTQAALAEGFAPPTAPIQVTVEAALTATTTISQDTGSTGGTCQVNQNDKTITFTGFIPAYEERSNGYPPRTTHWVGVKFESSSNEVTGVELNGKVYTSEALETIGGKKCIQSYFDLSDGTDIPVTVRWIKTPAARDVSALETFTIKKGTDATIEDYSQKTAVTVNASYVAAQGGAAAVSTSYQVKVKLTDGSFVATEAAKAGNWSLDGIAPSSVTVSTEAATANAAAEAPANRYSSNNVATLTFTETPANTLATPKLTINWNVFTPDTKAGQAELSVDVTGDKPTTPATQAAMLQVNNAPVASVENKETTEAVGEVKGEENKETVPNNNAETPNNETSSNNNVGTPSEGTTEQNTTDAGKETNKPQTDAPAEPTTEGTTSGETVDNAVTEETGKAEDQPQENADTKTEEPAPQADK